MEPFDVDADVLAERILKDLKNTFKKDPLIDEFDIIPVNDSLCNKCPVIHVEHKVALESWCVRHVFLYAYNNFMKSRQHSYKIDPSILLSWTSAILLINPDIETALNSRKELIQSNDHFPKDELKFSEIVLSRKPKSAQVFAHRKWVLLELMKDNLSHCAMQQVIEREFFLCTQMSNKYSNNYYSWSHRMWVIEKLAQFCVKVILEELTVTHSWVSSHVSDHSGFHYRQFLLKSINCSSSKACLLHTRCSLRNTELIESFANNTDSNYSETCDSLLMKELTFLSDLQLTFPGHETLWNHRRVVIHRIINFCTCAKTSLLPNKFSGLPDQGDDISHKKYKFESTCYSIKHWNLVEEENFILCCFQKAKDNMWESRLISRHQKWLEKIICKEKPF